MTTNTATEPTTATKREPLDGDVFLVTGRRASLARLAERTGGRLTRAEIRAHIAVEYGGRADDMLEHMIQHRELVPEDPRVPRPTEPVVWMMEQLMGLEDQERIDKALEIACEKIAKPFPERITAEDVYQAAAACEVSMSPRNLIRWLEARDKLKAHERIAHELVERVFNVLAPQLKPSHCEQRLCGKLRRMIQPGESTHHFKRAARALTKLQDPDPNTKAAALIAAIEASTPEIRKAAADLLFRLPASPLADEGDDETETDT